MPLFERDAMGNAVNNMPEESYRRGAHQAIAECERLVLSCRTIGGARRILHAMTIKAGELRHDQADRPGFLHQVMESCRPVKAATRAERC